MKRKLRLVLMGFILSLGTAAYADFNLYSTDPDICASLPGQWQGQGSASVLLEKCIYHGVGNIDGVDSAGNFTLHLEASKGSGSSILCPERVSQQLAGTCSNGNVTIRTDYGNLSGHFTKEKGEASGTLTVSPGVNADVNVQFLRVSR